MRKTPWASLGAQWWRICLLVQETWVRSLVGKIPLALEQLSLCTVLPVVRVPGRERRLLKTMQLAIGECITDSSQGLPPSPRVWGRKAPSPSSLRYLLGTIISCRKWIGYTVGSWCKRIGYTVGSWCKQIGYTVARQFLLSNVGLSAFPW